MSNEKINEQIALRFFEENFSLSDVAKPEVLKKFKEELEVENKIHNFSKEVKTEYFKKEKQIKHIELFLSFLASKYDNIINMVTLDDPEKKVSKIFVLKIPQSVSPKERMGIKSNIIDECVEYCEKNGLMDTLFETAIFVRR